MDLKSSQYCQIQMLYGNAIWKGQADLARYLSQQAAETVSTESDYNLRKHYLAVELFDNETSLLDKSGNRNERGLGDVLSAGVERCSFDAMIFVRDIPEEFRPRDLISCLQKEFSEMF